MKSLYPTIAICLLSLFSCKREKADIVPTTAYEPIDLPGPEIQLGTFPLDPGNLWAYGNGDTIRVIGDTTINGKKVTKLTKNNSLSSFDFYCVNGADGLYMLATTSTTAFQSLALPALEGNSELQVLDTPVQLTKLPAVISERWNTPFPGNNSASRWWVKYATVKGPVGSFNCVTVQSFNISEYYSDKGIAQFVIKPYCLQGPCPPYVVKLVYVNF